MHVVGTIREMFLNRQERGAYVGHAIIVVKTQLDGHSHEGSKYFSRYNYPKNLLTFRKHNAPAAQRRPTPPVIRFHRLGIILKALSISI